MFMQFYNIFFLCVNACVFFFSFCLIHSLNVYLCEWAIPHCFNFYNFLHIDI